MSDGLEIHIMMDIADWCARHHLTLPETAIIDAVQRIAAIHDERDTARGALRAVSRRVAAEAEQIERQQWRIDGLATAASIVLHELERDGQVQAHSRNLLASAVDAYEALKRDGHDD